MKLIKNLHLEFAQEIEQMNQLIINELDLEAEMIQIVAKHLLQASGKRLRPILTLITSKAFGYYDDVLIKLATAIEFIHVATLLHDDVVDGSKMRRFIPSANQLWGNSASILVGDFLFSKAFELIVACKSLPAINIIARTAKIISRGEVQQLSALKRKNIISEDEYLQIISTKTAELFGAAAEIGPVCGQKEQNKCNIIKEVGTLIGLMFQITDDKLDYFGTQDKTGKNIGDDFYEGKVTLPLIMLEKMANVDERTKIIHILAQEQREEEDFSWICQLLKTYGINQKIDDYTLNMQGKALKKINSLRLDNKYIDLLKSILEYIPTRIG